MGRLFARRSRLPVAGVALALAGSARARDVSDKATAYPSTGATRGVACAIVGTNAELESTLFGAGGSNRLRPVDLAANVVVLVGEPGAKGDQGPKSATQQAGDRASIQLAATPVTASGGGAALDLAVFAIRSAAPRTVKVDCVEVAAN
jgi:hypothetical protein